MKKQERSRAQNAGADESEVGSRATASVPVSASNVETELQSVYDHVAPGNEDVIAAPQAVPELQRYGRADNVSEAEVAAKALCDLCREGVHWLDQFCLVVFPVAFAAVCSTLLNDPNRGTQCSDLAELVPWGTMAP